MKPINVMKPVTAFDFCTTIITPINRPTVSVAQCPLVRSLINPPTSSERCFGAANNWPAQVIFDKLPATIENSGMLISLVLSCSFTIQTERKQRRGGKIEKNKR